MQKYKWKILCENTVSSADELLKVLGTNRQIADIKAFNNPPSPAEFIENDEDLKELVSNHAQPAAERIKRAIRENRPIIIHGDYDVDGQSATAILWRTIYNDLNYKKVHPYIPNRFEEGYGLSSESLDGMKKLVDSSEKPLLITVDCGIVSAKEIAIAKEYGFEVIITDHHQMPKEAPQPDELVWTEKATGAGISWIISYLLRDKASPEKYLDLATLGTVCDLQPLTGFNRSVAWHGLRELNLNPSTGIRALKDAAGLNKPVGSYELGWVLGPRLNASGRLESAMDSLRLLSTTSPLQAAEISKQLNEINIRRQEQTQSGLNLALSSLNEISDLPQIIFMTSDSLHEGIIGLIAGKLTQTYHRPAIVVAIDPAKGIAKGSARSIPGISIIEVLRGFEDLFINAGGHKLAAGFSISTKNLPKLKEKIESLNEWPAELFTKELLIEATLDPKQITEKTYNAIETFQPFGMGNPRPVFASNNFNVYNCNTFGKENSHLRIFLQSDSGQKITGLAFNGAELMDKITEGQNVNVAYNLALNQWNGIRTIELHIQDIADLT